MLDKSVVYYDIIMHRKKGSDIPESKLPGGFSFSLFEAGDEKSWAKIETSVLEFSDESDALVYFQKEYLPYLPELSRRCLFVQNGESEKVATAMAWWNYTGIRRDPWLHWVAVNPEYQGLGLGKAIISEAIALMADIEGDRDFYLHTQTWSHKAIKIYEKAGFFITSEKNLNGYANENYEKATEILRNINIDGRA